MGKRLLEQCVWPVGLLTLLAFVSCAWATPLTAWDFATNMGNEADSPATFVAPGFQTTLITRGGTQDPVAHPGTFWNQSWPLGPSLDGYFSFSINPSAGAYSISDIVFNLLTQPLGPNTWTLTTDSGGMLDTWTNFTGVVDTPSTHTTDLSSLSGFQNQSGPNTFRLYGSNSSGKGGGLTSLSINGSAAVPESLPLAGVLGLTAGLLLFVRSRVKD